jgi:predicted aminopeptidase
LFSFFRTNKKKLIIASVIIFVCTAILLFSIPITRYLLIQGFYQGKIFFGRKSIDVMLKDPNLDPQIREKLIVVGEIREFGMLLGLRETNSYKSVYDTGGHPIVYSVNACHKDRLQPVTWKFPIVGRMPYLGFFSRDDALREFKKLEDRGYDVLIRNVSAYSTLGILQDPLYTSMLRGSEEYLANTIIHEMTHETVFVKNDMDFNESLANFIGNQGAVEFLKHKYGENSEEVRLSLDYKHDVEIFTEFMANFYDRLNEFYNQPISSEEKIQGREQVFEETKTIFVQEIKPVMKTGNFNHFEKLKLNNAYVLYNRCYHKDYNIFEDLWQKQGGDLKITIEFLKSIPHDKNIKNRILEEIERLK